MSLSFASAVGNLFNRLGKVGLLVKQLNLYTAAQYQNMVNTTNGVVAQLNNEADIQAIMGDAYIGILSAADGNIGGTAQQLAQAIVNRMVFRDNARFNQTLTSSNTLASIMEIIRQMNAAAATVLAQTVTSTVSVAGVVPAGNSFTGTGNGVVVCSLKRPLDGRFLENAFAETIQLVCSADSYIGGATAFNEAFAVTGQGAQSDLFAFNWPLGSNGSISVNAIDGNSSNDSGNLLTNSGFEDWTSGVPDGWALGPGTTANIAQENTIVFAGNSSLKVIGDGSTLTTLVQPFGSSSGTQGTLQPLTQYSFNIYVRRDGIVPGAGKWEISLIDASTGAIINDAAATPNAYTIDLTGLTTTYATYNVAFRTPEIMPANLAIRMRHPVGFPLTAGRAVYFDTGSLGVMSQLYVHGPFLSVHGGSTPFTQGDYATVTTTNSRGAGGTLSTFQTLLLQLLPDVQQNEILWPSSATPTISDSLIG